MADVEKQVGTTGLRIRARDLDPLSSDTANKAYAEYVSLGPATPLGHERLTVTSTASSLTDLGLQASGIKMMHLYNLSADVDIYFTDLAGQEPGAALGFPIKADSWFKYDSDVDPAVFKLWCSGSATLAVASYA